MRHRLLVSLVFLFALTVGCVTGSASPEERTLFVEEVCAASEVFESGLFLAIAELDALGDAPGTFVEARDALTEIHHQVAADHAAYIEALEDISPTDDEDIRELYEALLADGRTLRARWEASAIDLRQAGDASELVAVTDELDEWYLETISAVTVVRGSTPAELRDAFADSARPCGSLVGVLTGESS